MLKTLKILAVTIVAVGTSLLLQTGARAQAAPAISGQTAAGQPATVLDSWVAWDGNHIRTYANCQY